MKNSTHLNLIEAITFQEEDTKLDLTHYAEVRIQQQRIQRKLLSLIMNFGTAKVQWNHNDTVKYSIPKKNRDQLVKQLKTAIDQIEKSTDLVMIVDNTTQKVITVYRDTRG